MELSIESKRIACTSVIVQVNLACHLKEYFLLFNVDRPHQSLGYSTPDKVYQTASGGGAGIVDKYNKLNKLTEELKVKEGQRLSAA